MRDPHDRFTDPASDPRRDPASDPGRAAFDRIRRQRNLVLGVILAGFVVLVYFISIARIG